MATRQFTPNLNSLRPVYDIFQVEETALSSTGANITFTFDQPFSKIPEVLSVYAIDPDGLAAVSVKSVSASAIILTYDTAGTGNDVSLSAIVQGPVS